MCPGCECEFVGGDLPLDPLPKLQLQVLSMHECYRRQQSWGLCCLSIACACILH